MNKQIKEILDARRLKAERVANHYKQLILSMPKVKKLYQEEVDLVLQKAKAEAFGQAFDPAPLNAAKARLDAVFAEIGFVRANLYPKYSCPICQDTGFVEGKECACVAKIKSELNLKQSQIANFMSFENIDYSMISTDVLKGIIAKLQKISQTENQKISNDHTLWQCGCGQNIFFAMYGK